MYVLETGRNKDEYYVQHKYLHVSLRNFVALSNIAWMMIAKYFPTKYWRRLSSVQHGDAQRLQKLKAPWKTKPTENEREKEHVIVLVS